MMKDSILALKYRPKKLIDCIGQDVAVRILTNSFKNNNLYPCYLLQGQSGSGKTTVLRILAAMENCEEGPTLEPCGKCSNCKGIFNGSHYDIKEINASQNRGIDDIRNIQEFIEIAPLNARVKYVGLDEVHMLTAEAQEAALKMLEEPPSYVRFVLATTDPQDLQETILNRCMSISFLKTTWPQLADYLKNISQLEKIEIDDSSLKIIAKMSGGSIRNGLKNLQTIWTAYPNELIDQEKTQLILGSIDNNLWFDFIENMVKINVPGCFKIIQDILSKGQEFKLILDGFQEHLRNLLVILSCNNTSGLIYLGTEEKQKYIEQTKKLSIDVVIDFISQLGVVAQNIEYNLSPQLLLEQYTISCMITIGKTQKKTENPKK